MSDPTLDGDWEKDGVKEHVRKEAHERCVYCGIHENFIGGPRAFHKDHFKPKAHFAELKDVLDNIYYSCQFCNTFKSDRWPNDPRDDHSVAAFANPSVVDYNDLFDIDWDRGIIEGKYDESIYICSQLYLNRPQLALTRQEYNLRRRREVADEKIEKALASISDGKLLDEYLAINASLRRIIKKGETVPRYEPEDVQR